MSHNYSIDKIRFVKKKMYHLINLIIINMLYCVSTQNVDLYGYHFFFIKSVGNTYLQ